MTDFFKMHGCGNDFIILDGRQNTAISALLADKDRIRALCDRRFGIGCDQLIVIMPHDTADAEMVIRNSDGSKADMCGNAARCVGDLILKENNSNMATIQVGRRLLNLSRQADGLICVDMGTPTFVNLQHVLNELPDAVCVDVGNPHAVFFVDDVDAVDIARLGPMVETNPMFPNKTNVEFVSVSGETLRMRVWERGAGVTLACGSGACASYVAARQKGLINGPCAVVMDGGTLHMDMDTKGHILMSGPVTYVCEGRLR